MIPLSGINCTFDADPSTPTGGMKTGLLSTVAVITSDPPASRRLYVDALGLPLEGQGDGYQHSERIPGCKSFGIWPLSQVAHGMLRYG